MAALDFPASPTVGDLFTGANGVIYQWTGVLWQTYGTTGLVTAGAAPTYDSTSSLFTDTGTVPAVSSNAPMQITQGVQVFNRVYTAVTPTNPIAVDVRGMFGGAGTAIYAVCGLFIDGAAAAVAQTDAVANTGWTVPFAFYYRAALSSGSHTFQLRFGTVSTTGYLSGSGAGAPAMGGGSIRTTMVVAETSLGGVQGLQGPVGPAGPTGGSSVNPQTGTAYTLVPADNNNIVTMNNASANVVTIPSGLGSGFFTTITQIGAGQTSVAAGGGVTLHNANGLKCRVQWSSIGVLAYVADGLSVGGDSTP